MEKATVDAGVDEEHGEGEGEEQQMEEEGVEQQQQQQQYDLRDDTNPRDAQGQAPRDSTQHKSTFGAKQPDLQRSFNHQIDKCCEDMSRLLSMYSASEWEAFLKTKQFKKMPHNLKAPLQPGVFFVAVSPLGNAYMRCSDSLSKNPLFKKYSDDLLWALKYMLNDLIRDSDKEDIGGNHSGPPQEFEIGEMTAGHKPSRGRSEKPQYSDQLKISVRALVKVLREKFLNPQSKARFCPADKRQVCSDGHNGECSELRQAFNWPKEVPCVDAGHLTNEQLRSVLVHYSSDFPDMVIPTQPLKQR